MEVMRCANVSRHRNTASIERLVGQASSRGNTRMHIAGQSTVQLKNSSSHCCEPIEKEGVKPRINRIEGLHKEETVGIQYSGGWTRAKDNVCALGTRVFMESIH